MFYGFDKEYIFYGNGILLNIFMIQMVTAANLV